MTTFIFFYYRNVMFILIWIYSKFISVGRYIIKRFFRLLLVLLFVYYLVLNILQPLDSIIHFILIVKIQHHRIRNKDSSEYYWIFIKWWNYFSTVFRQFFIDWITYKNFLRTVPNASYMYLILDYDYLYLLTRFHLWRRFKNEIFVIQWK